MNKPKTRNENIVVQEMESEILIYDLEINKAFCLNKTSAIIWQMCDGKRTVAEISQSLSEKSNQPIPEDLIWLALDGFKKDNLLENNERFAIDFNGLNRRQVIKKASLASMIALPFISSVVAPSAAMAQSGVVCNPCTINSGLQLVQMFFSQNPHPDCAPGCSTCSCTVGFLMSSCMTTCSVA